MLAVLLFASSGQAQTGDWRAVKNLRYGSTISVEAERHVRCIFRGATDDDLVCGLIQHGLIRIGPSEITIDRRNVREVRLEHSDEDNAAAGAAIGAGVGAALGTVKTRNGSLTRKGGALFIGGIGGIIGHFIGRDVHVLHGKIIYKR